MNGDLKLISELFKSCKDYFTSHNDDDHIRKIKQFLLDDLLTKVNEMESINSDYQVCILTVIDIEFESVCDAFEVSNLSIGKINDLVNLYRAKLVVNSGKPINVLVCKVGSAGNLNSSIVTNALLEKFEFKLMLLIGIAAGVRGRIKLGDVVFGRRVYYYEMEKFTSLSRLRRWQGYTIQYKFPDFISQPIYQKKLNDKYNSKPHHQAFYKDAKGNTIPVDYLKPNYLSNREYIILSGEKLRKDNKLVNLADEYHDYIRACEMEAAGFCSVCEYRNQNWLVIRGISDYGDEEKSNSFHYASSLAASFAALEFLYFSYDSLDV